MSAPSLQAAQAPVLEELETAEHYDKAVKGLLGGVRVATVKQRVRAAEAMSRWMSLARGFPWPRGPAEVVDYLYVSVAEEPRVSFPKAVAGMMHWVEVHAGTSVGAGSP